MFDGLICPIDNLASLQLYQLEIGTQAFVFRVEKRAEDVVPDRRERFGMPTLGRFHIGLPGVESNYAPSDPCLRSELIPPQGQNID